MSRLPEYLRQLERLRREGIETVSSAELARLIGRSGETVRRDLWDLRVSGLRGSGYRVDFLLAHVVRLLGAERSWHVAVLGAGRLGQAIARYGSLRRSGFRIVAIFDVAEETVGTSVSGLEVRHANTVKETVDALRIEVGIIATPAAAAQEVADLLTDAGVRAILNFAPVRLKVPRGSSVRNVDIMQELQLLVSGLMP